MRRPSPIATPAPERPAVAEPPSVDDTATSIPTAVADRADDRVVERAGEPAADAAPVIPLQPGVAASTETPVRLRDVWRAARARRRALRAEVRRFTVRQRRRRATWLGAIGAVVLLGLGTAAAAYGPLFAVEQIRVVGTNQLDAATVADALSDQVGTPLPSVDESAVKSALVAFPLVESYTLEARPPHELVVRIVERTPIGLIASAAGYTLVDAAGVALATTPSAPAGVPIVDVEGGVRSRAFTAAGLVMRSLPEAIRVQVTAVAATTADDVTLTLGATDTQVVWGAADDSAKKALVLQTTMNARPPTSVSMYDVSSPAAVVVR